MRRIAPKDIINQEFTITLVLYAPMASTATHGTSINVIYAPQDSHLLVVQHVISAKLVNIKMTTAKVLAKSALQVPFHRARRNVATVPWVALMISLANPRVRSAPPAMSTPLRFRAVHAQRGATLASKGALIAPHTRPAKRVLR